MSTFPSDLPPRVVALGELMLRLKSPGHERLLQSAVLEATFGGAEANVLVALAGDGIHASFLSALPTHAIGDAALNDLRQYGVHTQHIVRKEGRLGTYFLEAGAGHRPGRVIYDRAGSVFANLTPDDLDWDACFSSATWLHVSGITPAVSRSAADTCLRAVIEARQRGLTVSCDYNFRSNLWKWGKTAPEVMREIVRHVHVGIAGRGDCLEVLGVRLDTASENEALNVDWYRELALKVLEEFPNLGMQVITLREGEVAGAFRWSACLHNRQEFLVSRQYEINEVVDRVGAGDAFAAGLIYSLVTRRTAAHALEFATAAGCLKHTIPGDYNRVRAAEVEATMRGLGGGRIQR